jgi:four helix bundle protein
LRCKFLLTAHARWHASCLGCSVAGVRDHSELDVYQLAEALERRVAAVIARPEVKRDPDLAGQLKRASEGPCPNIAEGFSRYYPRDNARFVRIAKGSFSEVIIHITKAARKGLISEREADEICRLARRARGAATAYIRYLERAPRPPP